MSEFNAEAWGVGLVPAGCGNCDRQFLVHTTELAQACPICGREELAAIENGMQLPYLRPPELHIPFSVGKSDVKRSIDKFADGIPFAPDDLNAAKLHTRLKPLYIPLWLADVDVEAEWQAEVGFDYQVLSHRERLSHGNWRKEEVRETRIRWEPRLGLLERHYPNSAAPAIEDHAQLTQRLGNFKANNPKPFQPAENSHIYQLPNRIPRDAWPDIRYTLHTRAAEECWRAASADHIREFQWHPTFKSQHWTHLLAPLYSTYYLDDEGQPQMVLIHGETGRLFGMRRASMKKAKRLAIIIAIIAFVIGLIGFVTALVGIVAPPVLFIAVPILIVALLAGLGALIPIYRAHQFNHKADS